MSEKWDLGLLCVTFLILHHNDVICTAYCTVPIHSVKVANSVCLRMVHLVKGCQYCTPGNIYF